MRCCFYTCEPPLRDLAYGNHGVSRNFIDIFRRFSPVILTRKTRRGINITETEEICADLTLWVHPSASGSGLRRFLPTSTGILDSIIFALWLPLLWLRLKKAKVDRIFVLCGADAWFLLNVWLIQRIGLPVDVYLVDDIEDSPRRGMYKILGFLIRPLLQTILKSSSIIYAISPGFAEYLSTRYQVPTRWLPLPAPEFNLRSTSKEVIDTKNRNIVFIGAINHLYEDALRELYDEIQLFNNSEEPDYRLQLEIISYADTSHFTSSLPNRDSVITFEKLGKAELQEHLANSYACFLPYSFAESARLMVSTSFSCKILEYFNCGRPILVYGPEYASIPRYFQEQGLPLCATSQMELRELLPKIAEYNPDQLSSLYHETWELFHSPDAIRKKLCIDHSSLIQS